MKAKERLVLAPSESCFSALLGLAEDANKLRMVLNSLFASTAGILLVDSSWRIYSRSHCRAPLALFEDSKPPKETKDGD